jgi:hypothetical protein
MKIRAKYPEYSMNNPKIPSKNASRIGFEGSFAAKPDTVDKVLKSNFAQKLFEIADNNSHVFNLINLAIYGMALRPATLLTVPGAEKEDKQYVAAKSLIGTTLIVASELLICIPLGAGINKLGKMAKQNPEIKFPVKGSKQFKAYSFLINNVVGLVLTLALSSFLTVRLTTKIMNKLFPPKDSKANKNTQNPQGKERAK